MVWAGESCSPNEGRNNNGLEIGCLVNTTNGLLTFTANGKELGTHYQVNLNLNVILTATKTTTKFSRPLPMKTFLLSAKFFICTHRVGKLRIPENQIFSV